MGSMGPPCRALPQKCLSPKIRRVASKIAEGTPRGADARSVLMSNDGSDVGEEDWLSRVAHDGHAVLGGIEVKLPRRNRGHYVPEPCFIEMISQGFDHC